MDRKDIKMRSYGVRKRKHFKNDDLDESDKKITINTGIKEMPAYDPDMAIRGLTLTIPIAAKNEKADKYFVKLQNKQFIKSAIITDRFQRKTGRTKGISDNLQYVLNKKQKLRLLAKKDKSYKTDLSIEKLNGILLRIVAYDINSLEAFFQSIHPGHTSPLLFL